MGYWALMVHSSPRSWSSRRSAGSRQQFLPDLAGLLDEAGLDALPVLPPVLRQGALAQQNGPCFMNTAPPPLRMTK